MSFATRIKVFSVLSQVHILASISLIVSALATSNFFGGQFYTQDDDGNGNMWGMQAGLFGSCYDDNCDSSDPFYWSSLIDSFTTSQLIGQWTSLQTFLVAQLGFFATGWLLMKVRSNLEKNHPKKTSWAINVVNFFAVISGAITVGLMTSMPGSFVDAVGGAFWLNVSSVLQICAFPIGTMGVFWYALARWYINKSIKQSINQSADDSNTSWLLGQQVAISVNGKTLMAQILPANQQPFLVVPDQSINQTINQSCNQPIVQPLLQAVNQPINQWPINQSINLPQVPQYVPNTAAVYHQGHMYNHAGYVQPHVAYQTYQPINQ